MSARLANNGELEKADEAKDHDQAQVHRHDERESARQHRKEIDHPEWTRYELPARLARVQVPVSIVLRCTQTRNPYSRVKATTERNSIAANSGAKRASSDGIDSSVMAAKLTTISKAMSRPTSTPVRSPIELHSKDVAQATSQLCRPVPDVPRHE